MPKNKAYVHILAIAVSLTVLVNNSVFNLGLGDLYYALLIGVFALLLITGKRPELNFTIFFFIIACLCSIIVNDIPYFFKPYERLAIFVITLGLIGPLFKTARLDNFKLILLKTINVLIVAMVGLSFLGLILNVSLVFGRSGFVGLFNQSMMLSPMAAFSLLICIHWANTASITKYRVLFYTLAVFSLITCIAAGSRSALLGAILGIIYYYYCKNKNNLFIFFRTLIILIMLSVVSFPLWKPYTETLIHKMEYAEEQEDLTATRAKLWERRIDEFISSPLFGIGYSNDSQFTENDLTIGEGQIEPGSSWLVILSMLGVLGFAPFIIIFLSLFSYVHKNTSQHINFVHFGALLVFFTIHMMAEGYLLSAGSGLFFYFWLLLGVINVCKGYQRISI